MTREREGTAGLTGDEAHERAPGQAQLGHPVLALQRQIGNRAVTQLVQRGGNRKATTAKAPELTAYEDEAIVIALSRILDTGHPGPTAAELRGIRQPYLNHLLNLKLAVRGPFTNLDEDDRRILFGGAMTVLKPVIKDYAAEPYGIGAEFVATRITPLIASADRTIEYAKAAAKVTAERDAAEGTGWSGMRKRFEAKKRADTAKAKRVTDLYIKATDLALKGTGEKFDRRTALRRLNVKGPGTLAARSDMDDLAKLTATAKLLKSAKGFLDLSDDEFAKKLHKLEGKGPLGKVRSKVELVKTITEMAHDGLSGLTVVTSRYAAASGNTKLLGELREFDAGALKGLGDVAHGLGKVEAALRLLDEGVSKEGADAAADLIGGKVKTAYDIGKNAITILDQDEKVQSRLDAAMEIIAMMGPLGTAVSRAYKINRFFMEQYGEAREGIIGWYMRRGLDSMFSRAQGIVDAVNEVEATYRVLAAEDDARQLRVLMDKVELDVARVAERVDRFLANARQGSSYTDPSDYGGYTILREHWSHYRSVGATRDPVTVMRRAMAVLGGVKWCSENAYRLMKAESWQLSLQDVHQDIFDEAQAAKKKHKEEAKRKAAEKKKQAEDAAERSRNAREGYADSHAIEGA